MAPDPLIVALSELPTIPYIQAGQLPSQFAGQVGAYAIFAADHSLQYVGYSRDIYLSLKQHLVRQPRLCHWLKAQPIDRPSRSTLEQIRQGWIAEYGSLPAGNSTEQAQWEQPIDVKAAMTSEEHNNYTNPQLDEIARQKILKNAARRIESEIFSELESRQLEEPLRFNPKLKDSGLLDLKSS
jgi:hypothetical protein